MLYTETAIVIALVHVMLPFMVIPVWTSLQKLDPASRTPRCRWAPRPSPCLRRVVLPQVMPGMLSGSLIVFGLAASSFAIPGLLGGRRLKMVATIVYDEYLHELELAARRRDRAGAAGRQPGGHAELQPRCVEGRYKKTLG